MPITYRKGTIEDSYPVFQVFVKAIMDYSERKNVMGITGGNDPEVLRSLWERRRSMFEHLAENSPHFWVVEEEREIAGYARSIEHDGMIELTEFFVLPGRQSGGLGRELLARAFPRTDSPHRVIVATLDERALSRYLKNGVYARFPIKYFSRKAEKVDFPADLSFETLQPGIHLAAVNRIDQQVLGHDRGPLQAWIASAREGFICKRAGEIVGYGYEGGPYAVMDEEDLPAMLAYAESQAAEKDGDFGVETPLINKKAIGYLIDRKYRMDDFTALFMSNEPFGRFENYLCFSPLFFM
jgi:GNAT superfamily N-acetyltransferase